MQIQFVESVGLRFTFLLCLTAVMKFIYGLNHLLGLLRNLFDDRLVFQNPKMDFCKFVHCMVLKMKI